MHRALRALYDEAGRQGLLHLLPTEPALKPCPETGLRVEGADRAFRDLVREDLLIEQGRGLDAILTVDQMALVSRRRNLMKVDPRLASLFQRCGERWAALASTSAKTFESARASSGAMVLSVTA